MYKYIKCIVVYICMIISLVAILYNIFADTEQENISMTEYEYISHVVDIMYPYYSELMNMDNKYSYMAYELGYIPSISSVTDSKLSYGFCCTVWKSVIEQQGYNFEINKKDFVESGDEYVYYLLEELGNMTEQGVKTYVKPLGNVVSVVGDVSFGRFTTKGLNVGVKTDNLYSMLGVSDSDIIYSIDGIVLEPSEYVEYIQDKLSLGDCEISFSVYSGNDLLERVLEFDGNTNYNFSMSTMSKNERDAVETLSYVDLYTGELSGAGHRLRTTGGVPYSYIDMSVSMATVSEIEKSETGAVGKVSVESMEDSVAILNENSLRGTKGYFTSADELYYNMGADVAPLKTPELGLAYMYTNVLGEFDYYAIEIIGFASYSEYGYDFLYSVKDRRILDTFGGIVGGMSGTPIIQNGSYIGCVSGVLLEDSAKGIGVFIE